MSAVSRSGRRTIAARYTMSNEKGLPAGRQAIVLLSGGLDSATTLYLARRKGYQAHCLSFEYGQRHHRELRSARLLAKAVLSPLEVIRISLPWKGSSLLDLGRAIPRYHDRARREKSIPSTYVPARNTIFLSFALSYAETIGAKSIFIGANAIDYSGYPDCRPEYFKAFDHLARLATRSGVEQKTIKVCAPLIGMTKAQIIRLGAKLGVPYHLSWSCYRGAKEPCGYCDSCVLRAKGFREAGLKDPLGC